jgi:hypothetical protein
MMALFERTKINLIRVMSSPPFSVFISNLILVHPVFLPEMHDLGLWDEAAFIELGYVGFSDGLPAFAGNPLMYALYRVLYLIFKGSPFWMVHCASVARLLMFSLLWLATYLVATRIRKHVHPLVVMGLFLVLPYSLNFLTFPSDPVFAGFAALSLWALLGYFQDADVNQLYHSSIFMGLAAFSRNDGLVLFVILVGLTVMLSWRKPRFMRAMLAVLLPFVVMVFGYVGVRGVLTGDFALGTVERTYQNFESGHLVLLSDDGGVGGTIEARLEARQVYGTPEENQYSVFRAIMRAPDVYLQRLVIALKGVPVQLLNVYGKRFAGVLFLVALWGAIELFRQRDYKLLAILLLWPAHLVTGAVITIFRPGHLYFPFYIILALSAIGLSSLVENWRRHSIQRTWSIILAGVAILGLLDNKLALTYNAGLALVALWIAYWVRQWKAPQAKNGLLASWMVLLVVGVVMRGGFPSFKVRTLGDDPREQALLALYEYLDEGDLVATRDPGMIWAAKMTPLTLASTSVPFDLPADEFMAWLIDQDVKAVYADHVYATSPAIWEKIQPYIGTELERVFIADGGDIQLLIVTSNQDTD